jgi:sporulation protein YlmC with PRC-barrel domain
MKLSELKGRAVVNLEDARKIGDVEDLMVEPETHHIVSVKVRTGMFHAAQIISVSDIKSVGADAITISTGAGTANSAAMAQPATQQAEKPQSSGAGSSIAATTSMSSADSVDPRPLIEITSLLGNKVVTDAGTMVGELSDVMVDWVDLTITGYEVRTGGLFTKAQEFVDTPGVRYGNKLLTIPAELLNHPK